MFVRWVSLFSGSIQKLLVFGKRKTQRSTFVSSKLCAFETVAPSRLSPPLRLRKFQRQFNRIIKMVAGQALLEAAVSDELQELISSNLTSFETTLLRAASRSCRDSFTRHCLVSTAAALAFERKEDLTLSPSADFEKKSWDFRVMNFRAEDFQQVQGRNRHSPLKCWILPLAKGVFLQYFEDYCKFGRLLLKHKAFAMTVVSRDGCALEFMDVSTQQDREIVLAAVTQSGAALQYTDEIFKRDTDVVLRAVNEYAEALMWADDKCKQDRDVVLTAVRKHGMAFVWADKKFRKDREIVLTATTTWGWALQHADASLQSDRDVVLAAVMQNGEALAFASKHLREDRLVVEEALKDNLRAFEFADTSLRCDPSMLSLFHLIKNYRASRP